MLTLSSASLSKMAKTRQGSAVNTTLYSCMSSRLKQGWPLNPLKNEKKNWMKAYLRRVR